MSSPSRQRRVLDYMDARLGDDISLKELAAIADLSVHHFGAAFKATTGVSPHRFLMERRIQRGKELLLEPGPSIASIAYELGFSSHSHFTFCFRKLTGTTPMRFRLDRLQ